MKLLIQRVTSANVRVDNKIVGEIDRGLLIFVGITHSDSEKDVKWLAQKVAKLRIFNDLENKMNLALKDCNGAVLAISQFTLYADAANGNRPSFIAAARPQFANTLYELFVAELRGLGITVQTGVFGADMQVELINDGPVTIILESAF
ncbi:MAG: D-tyrosyl-tRNA(Tyr) deacylase [Neisseriaceae bacterium]|nr:MAG: D-tyrosyl-tRNA(Tyr) deacylase [Neisseriaceae bacterium]